MGRWRRVMGWIGAVCLLAGCATASGPRMQTAGRWGQLAPRFHKDGVSRDGARLLLERTAWVAVYELTAPPRTLRLVYPWRGGQMPRLGPGEHDLLFLRAPDRPDWVPEATLLVFAVDRPLTAEQLAVAGLAVSAAPAPKQVADALGAELARVAGAATWEGFLFRLAQYPDRVTP